MRFETKAIGMVLASACLAMASGCKGEKDFELQDIHLVSAQVTNFSLQRARHDSQKKEDLRGYAFSISNNANEGLIENETPLPYQSVLDSVKLNIRLSGDSARTSIELAFGNGAFAPFKADSIYSIADDIRKLRLKVTYRDVNAGGVVTPYEYNYQVKLRQYTNNPETISWREANTLSRPLLSASALYYIPQSDRASVLLWEVGGTSTAGYTLGYSTSGAVAQAMTHSGLPSGETLKQVVGYDNHIYALSSAGYLYRLSNNVWTLLDSEIQAQELLGVFPPRSSSSSPSLALIVSRGGEKAFARYDGRELTSSNAAIPSSFPISANGSKAYRQAYTQNLNHIGPSIMLLGANQSATELTRSAWYTTDGLDWIQRHSSSEAGANVASSVAFALISGKYYRLETSPIGLNIYTSADSGVNWTKNGTVALPSGDIASGLVSAPLIAWGEGSQTLYVYRGASSAPTASLLVGTLLKDEVN